MKKFTVIMTVLAMFAGNAAFSANLGQGATAAGTAASDDFAWGPAVGGIVLLGVIVGVTASAAAHTPSTFSHTH